jgi:hypothetical protein
MKQSILDLRDIIGINLVRWCILIVGNEDLKVNLLVGYYNALKTSYENEVKNNG